MRIFSALTLGLSLLCGTALAQQGAQQGAQQEGTQQMGAQEAAPSNFLTGIHLLIPAGVGYRISCDYHADVPGNAELQVSDPMFPRTPFYCDFHTPGTGPWLDAVEPGPERWIVITAPAWPDPDIEGNVNPEELPDDSGVFVQFVQALRGHRKREGQVNICYVPNPTGTCLNVRNYTTSQEIMTEPHVFSPLLPNGQTRYGQPPGR